MKTLISCEEAYRCLGECWHIWSGENFESFLIDESDYATCICIIGICAKLNQGISILTFEVMSNHIHICCAGDEFKIVLFTKNLRKMLEKALKSEDKLIRWESFQLDTRKLTSLEDVRNVIAYINRNGFIVNRQYSPYTYPWGANSFFFNEYRCALSRSEWRPVSLRERRRITHSRAADEIDDLMQDSFSVSPLCFCSLDIAMSLFKDAAHYFYKLGRSVEASKEIAKECGEHLFYTDDELFAAACSHSRKNYGASIPSTLRAEEKVEMAKTLRWDYNATPKQISRILKMDYALICRMFGI